ncbi:MAG: hypothetical protein WAN17_05195 [Candidatus Sulfotelmatobacter sp.]
MQVRILTPAQKWQQWLAFITRKHNLTHYSNLAPVLTKQECKDLCGHRKTKKAPWSRKSQYVTIAYPNYKPQITIQNNSIGWDSKGNLMFLYLQNVLPQRVRDTAFAAFQQMQFRSCNKSGRLELKGAVAFNGHKNPEASEINTGYMHLAREFKIKQSAVALPQMKNVVPLLDAMSGIYARVLPRYWRIPNMRIKQHHRHGFTPFTTITFLKSAPASVHLDARNGADSLACMTSVADPDPAKRYSGGAFCFIEYGVEIRVRPGDLLIGATPKNWHCNLSPVQGLKYSVIAYSKKALRRQNPLLPEDSPKPKRRKK